MDIVCMICRTHSKIEPAAINIFRDITKCLNCYGFFEKECSTFVFDLSNRTDKSSFMHSTMCISSISYFQHRTMHLVLRLNNQNILKSR